MLSRQIYRPFGLVGYANNLKAEFFAQPFCVKFKWWRGVLTRELMLWISGQKFLQKKHFDLESRPRILWVYDGLSMGDCIMDLSQRFQIAKYAEVDLCMTRAPCELFESDPAFRYITNRPENCDGAYDLVLLHNISTASIRLKRRHFSKFPFATMLGHQQGEMYDRVTYTWCRFKQLFGPGFESSPQRPTIQANRNVSTISSCICVALGSVDRRRCYDFWPQVLKQIVDDWPVGTRPPPRFVLVGSGASAKSAYLGFERSFLKRYCDCVFDVEDIRILRDSIARSEYYLGVDGGAMHIAEALNKPGLAIFAAPIRPEWRLLNTTRLHAVDSGASVNSLAAGDISRIFLSLVE